MKKEYQQRVESWMRDLALRCREQRIDYVPVTTSTSFDRALLAYLNKRSQLG